MKSISLLLPLLAAVYVSAHGYLESVQHNGRSYKAPAIGTKGTSSSPIRAVSSQDPNVGVRNPALPCGPNSQPASGKIDVKPGDTLSFRWRTANNQNWPHNTGPVLTYVASCGSQSCDKVNPSALNWFKVAQAGRPGNRDNGPWIQQQIMDGKAHSVALPGNLAAGNYLVRSEIIALHLTPTAEFYPGCATIAVSGNRQGRPRSQDLVKFPGAYDNAQVSFSRGVYGGQYTFPGPRVAELVESGAPATPTTTSKGSSSTGVDPKPTKVTGSCKLRRRETAEDDDEFETIVIRRPRAHSRIMRRLAMEQSLKLH